MSSLGASDYVYFYLNCDAFKISAEQQLSEMQLRKLKDNNEQHEGLESLRDAAMNIHETYLRLDLSRLASGDSNEKEKTQLSARTLLARITTEPGLSFILSFSHCLTLSLP